MNKNLVRFLLAFALLLCLGIYFFSNSNNKISDKKFRDLKLNPKQKVDKILITQKGLPELVLTFEENHWKINNKSFANNEKVNELLRISSLIEAKFKLKNIKKTGIKIQFISNEETLKSINIGGNNDSIPFYAFLDENAPIFAIHVPGENIDFVKLFSPKTEDWQSLILFQNSSISSTKVRLNYPELLDSSFTVELQNEVPKVYVLNKGIKVNLDKTGDYLRQFKKIEAKKFEFNNIKNSNKLGNLFFELTVNNKVLKGYRKSSEAHQKDFEGKPLKWDNEFFYGNIDDNWYLLDYFTFDGILILPSNFR